ncbi:hypothetical protein EDB80DRAFT_446946 [Ilyonectria destructans]|nr:hypothetical protein EDB80DRAFT_446946 [Ilyonectria destructans]
MSFSVILNSVAPIDSLENASDLARTTASGHRDRGSATAIQSLAENDYEKSDSQPRTLDIDEERLLADPSFFDDIEYANIDHARDRQSRANQTHISASWNERDAKLCKLYKLQGYTPEEAAEPLGKSTEMYKEFTRGRALSCQYCPGRVIRAPNYPMHQNLHMSHSTSYTCVYCNGSFLSWLKFSDHVPFCGWKEEVVDVSDYGTVYFYCFQQLVRISRMMLLRIVKRCQYRLYFEKVSVQNFSKRGEHY